MKHLTTSFVLSAFAVCVQAQNVASYQPDANGDGCIGIPDLLSLIALFGTGDCPPFECGSPLEYQGYEYATVQIGEQCWFAENLRSENYDNGDAITAGLSAGEWMSIGSGAVAVYGENSDCSNFSTDIDACDPNQSLNEYGRLYNGYAVLDARGLCPSGWHVATDGDWTVMTDHLGGSSVAGGPLKRDYGWLNGGNGTNSSGFSGLPGGYRDDVAFFNGAGALGLWWSLSPDDSLAWWRQLSYYNENVLREPDILPCGLSIRCVQD